MGLSSFFSSLFGKAKQTTENVGDALHNTSEAASDKIESFSKEVADTVTDIGDTVSNKLEEMGVSETVTHFADKAKDTITDAGEWLEEKAADAKESVSDWINKAEDKVDNVSDDTEAEKTTE
jgi:hypothetical protein